MCTFILFTSIIIVLDVYFYIQQLSDVSFYSWFTPALLPPAHILYHYISSWLSHFVIHPILASKFFHCYPHLLHQLSQLIDQDRPQSRSNHSTRVILAFQTNHHSPILILYEHARYEQEINKDDNRVIRPLGLFLVLLQLPFSPLKIQQLTNWK